MGSDTEIDVVHQEKRMRNKCVKELQSNSNHYHLQGDRSDDILRTVQRSDDDKFCMRCCVKLITESY